MTISRLIIGDCLDVMATLPADSVHAIVTDPPYGLEFMGKEWDKLGAKTGDSNDRWVGPDGRSIPQNRVCYGKSAASMQGWHRAWAVEALRVAKPGAFLLAFGGTRTFHRLTCAIEDAGWEIRDCVMWLYGSGFPKSLDVSKAIDKAAGVEREVVGKSARHGGGTLAGAGWNIPAEVPDITAPATDAAKQWDGWGTALKPAWEPIIVARKPLDGTVANNVLKHGCGGLNVDGCRVKGIDPQNAKRLGKKYSDNRSPTFGQVSVPIVGGNLAGRWPANVVHDGSDEVVGEFPEQQSPAPYRRSVGVQGFCDRQAGEIQDGYGDSGSAARFFYCCKASRRERNAGCEGLPQKIGGGLNTTVAGDSRTGHKTIQRNNHPTVKPLALMEWLVTLVAPLGGTVLDPFMGSGTTGIACGMLGHDFIGIEKDPQYIEIAKARVREHCGLLVELAGE